MEGFGVKAATFASRKWAWVARSGAVGRKRGSDKRSFMVVQASLGRWQRTRAAPRSDEELAALAAKERLSSQDCPLNRWSAGSIAGTTRCRSNKVGHRGRMALVREALVDTPGWSCVARLFDGVGDRSLHRLSTVCRRAGVVTCLSEQGTMGAWLESKEVPEAQST